MKYNISVAYDPENLEAEYIYITDAKTGDLFKVNYGNGEEYGANEFLENEVFGDNSLPAISTSEMSKEDVLQVYRNFVYDLRMFWDHPPLWSVFLDTEYEGKFN